MNYRDPFPEANDSTSKHPVLDKARRTPPEDWARLYLLSYLLTADRTKAEQCIAAGLELSSEDNAALRDWTHSWARRIVIHNALRLIAPQPDSETLDAEFNRTR